MALTFKLTLIETYSYLKEKFVYLCIFFKLTDVVIVENGKENEKGMNGWKLVPPDGGWGWLVLFGSTLVNVLVPGTVKSFGVLFVEFLEVFDASSVAAAWIPALCYFLYSSLGKLIFIKKIRFHLLFNYN